MDLDGNSQAGPLRGMNVVEIADEPVVQFAGRLLALLGANVTKVEAAQGDPLRRVGPYFPYRESLEASVPFQVLNGEKRIVTLSPGLTYDSPEISGLVDGSDISIVSEGGPFSDVTDQDHRAVIAVLDADRRKRDGSPAHGQPLTRISAAGTINLVAVQTGSRPVAPGRFTFEAMCGVALAGAIVSASLKREANATRPVRLRFSTKAYGVWLEKMFVHRVTRDQYPLDRFNHAYPYGGIVRCSDGFVCIYVIEQHQWRSLAVAIGREEWLNDPRFSDGLKRVAHAQVIQSGLEEWTLSKSVDDVMALGREHDLPIGRVMSPAALLDRDSLWKRGFLQTSSVTGVRVGLPYGQRFKSLPNDHSVSVPPMEGHRV